MTKNLHIKLDAKKNILRIYARGDVTIDDFLFLIESRSRYKSNLNMVCDFRDVEKVLVETEHINQLLNLEKHKRLFQPGAKVAVVASQNIVYGVSRMYEMLAGELPQTIRVFREMTGAEKWLEID